MPKFRRTSKKLANMRQIADELEISVSLVSKVLSGRMGTSGVSSAKAQAIHGKAAELHYRKNRMAEALRMGRQSAIAVCIHRHGEPGSGIVEDLVAGIAEEASLHRQRLLLQYYDTAEEFRALLPEVHRGAVDGVIMGGIGHSELVNELMNIHKSGLPVVTIHDAQLDADLVNVGINQVEVSRRATAHLIEQGCRRIAHFPPHGSEPSPHAIHTDRYEGYRRALREAGIEYRSELVVPAADYSYESGYQAALRLLASGIGFDGIVGQSDGHTAAAVNCLVQRGWKIPQQARLIGVDNAPFCQFAIVPLSSVSQEFNARGRQAVQMLLAGLNGEQIESTELPPVVHVRDSSGIGEQVKAGPQYA